MEISFVGISGCLAGFFCNGAGHIDDSICEINRILHR